jgi:hypothetical protein
MLAGEVVFADRPPGAVEGFERLTVGVQRFAPTTREAFQPEIVSIRYTSSVSATAGKLRTSHASCASTKTPRSIRAWPERLCFADQGPDVLRG